jgi:hypothetical protein
MSKKKICLFTAHSPLLGGGGVILRSLIAQLANFDITWYYIGNKPATGYENGYLGRGLMGGPILKDIWQTRQMLTGGKVAVIEEISHKLLAIDCDAYWIVSHNEGLRIAVELVARQTQRPVHLTVHDDWAGALCARSIRYRFMAGAAKQLTIAALKAVTSFDVISAGMQNYYLRLSGIKGDVCHRYLAADELRLNTVVVSDQFEILAGHIGSIYNKKDFIAFLQMFVDLYKSEAKKPVMQMWGCHLALADIPERLRPNIRLYGPLPENQVIPELQKCAFVYGMYPLGKALHTFASTSLPTKLTSYLQAGTPILGHGPADSTLAGFLSATGLGTIWVSDNLEEGKAALTKLMALNPTPAQWQAARQCYFGEANLAVMNKVLGGEAAVKRN